LNEWAIQCEMHLGPMGRAMRCEINE
jgi:hypothetical protein